MVPDSGITSSQKMGLPLFHLAVEAQPKKTKNKKNKDNAVS